MKKIYTVSILGLFLLGISNGFSQGISDINISGDFQNKPLIEILNEIEKEHHILFFYQEEWLSDIKVTENFQDTSFIKVFENILNRNKLSFIAFNPYSVFLINKAPDIIETTVALPVITQILKTPEEPENELEEKNKEYKNINFSMNELKLKAGFNRNLGGSGKLIVDTLLIKKPVISLTKVERKIFVKSLDVKVKPGNVIFKTYQINYADLHDLTVKVYDNKGGSLPIFSIDKGWIKARNILVKTDNKGMTNFRPGNLSFELNKVSFNNSTRNFFDINQIKYYKQRGQIDIGKLPPLLS